jgi:hypothetical protein
MGEYDGSKTTVSSPPPPTRWKALWTWPRFWTSIAPIAIPSAS